mmetsp:Transcript_10116/g.15982  ORF Transcript_10116/g.15982 Transcript_10116/m.15982 type:complete len:487 (+) Transcript_10116:88-1548(+)
MPSGSVESWISRLQNSAAGIGIGFLLFFGSFPLLFWNEARAVARYDTLTEGAAQTVSVSSTSIDPANDGKLVHLTATIHSSDSDLRDPIFGVSTTDLTLNREVEMYQWHETSETKTRETQPTGGSSTETRQETITTYKYHKAWSKVVQRSSLFHDRTDHENPTSFPFGSLRLRQSRMFADEFELPEELFSKVRWFTRLDYDWDVSEIADLDVQDRSYILRSSGGGYFIAGRFHNRASASQSYPTVGDTRVTFSSAKPRTISVIAEQRGSTLQRWEAEESDGSILLFNRGSKTAEQLFAKAEAKNAAATWALRLLGFLLMGGGICLILEPIAIFAGAVPLLGDVVTYGIVGFAFIIAGFFAGLTISVAWLLHHPTIGGIILLVFTVITWLALQIGKSCSQQGENGGEEKEDEEEEEGQDEEAPHQQNSKLDEEEEEIAVQIEDVEEKDKTVEEGQVSCLESSSNQSESKTKEPMFWDYLYDSSRSRG